MSYIEGPVSIIRMRSVAYEKDLYLIGDFHFIEKRNLKKNSIEYVKYINDFFITEKEVNPDVMYDYIIEDKFFSYKKQDVKSHETIRTGESYLSDFINFYEKHGCFSVNKKNVNECSDAYPNVRFHIGDIRVNTARHKTKDYLHSFLGLGEMLGIMFFYARPYTKTPADYLKYIRPFIKDNIEDLNIIFNNITTKKKMLGFYKKVFKIELLAYQLDKMSKKESKIINSIIRDAKNSGIKLIEKIPDKFFEDSKKLIQVLNKKDLDLEDATFILNILKYSFIFTVDTYLPLVDIYVISRLFKTFSDKKHKTMRKIFIHFGNQHILNIRSILEKYFDFEIVSEHGITTEKINLEYKQLNKKENKTKVEKKFLKEIQYIKINRNKKLFE